jgi:hypothetical protein
MVWPQGRKEVEDFQQYLSSIHPNVRFIMEMEEDH